MNIKKFLQCSIAAIAVLFTVFSGYAQSKEASATTLWMNGTFAILTELNGNDYTMFGTMENNAENKQHEINMLKEWWDVTDRASADATLSWLLYEGHRQDYVSTMKMMEKNGAGKMMQGELNRFASDITGDATKGWYLANAYRNYKQYGAAAIDGWDYCRAMSLISWYYIAGYYTKDEALNKLLETAQLIQKKFSSWDALMDSYLRGYEYWSESSSDERRNVYEDIKKRADSPYRLDWNLKLETGKDSE